MNADTNSSNPALSWIVNLDKEVLIHDTEEARFKIQIRIGPNWTDPKGLPGHEVAGLWSLHPAKYLKTLQSLFQMPICHDNHCTINIISDNQL